MKTKIIIFLLLLVTLRFVQAQNKIIAYQYAFNDGQYLQTVTITPTADFYLDTDIDVSMLTKIVNIFHIRFLDESGKWSAISSKLFIKPLQSETATDVKITGYEYYFNNDFANRQSVDITSTDDFQLISDLDVSHLPGIVNVLNIRFKDSQGKWSSVVSKLFIKPLQSETATDVKITGYEYYFNNDFANRQSVDITPTDDYNLVADIDMSSLPNALNSINLRFKDSQGKWSPMISKLIFKTPDITPIDAKIVSYEYWVEGDLAHKKTIVVNPAVDDLNVADLDMRHIWRGQHVLHTRYKDSEGKYSSITTDTITKMAYPYVQFEADKLEICEGESITFTNNSVDYDTVIWDFGDGTTSNQINEVHTYNTPGTYQVSLSITETNTGQTAQGQQTVTVYEVPANTVSVSGAIPACYGETLTLTADASGMNYLWSTGETTQSIQVNTAGNYSVQISNPQHTACSVTSGEIVVSFYPEIDNTVTVQTNPPGLTANQSGAAYQWLDCDNNMTAIAGETQQSFIPTQSGNYAVEITMNGCVSVSGCQNITVSGIDQVWLQKLVKIYPNPVENVLNLESQEKVSIQIINILGQKVLETVIEEGKHQINLNNLNSGTYFIRITVQSGSYKGESLVKQFVKG